MKIEVAAKEYLVEIEVRKFTKKTIRSYRNNLNLFLRYCQEEADVFDMEDLSLAVIRKFTLYMSGKGRKGSYINVLLKVAKAFIQYCYEEGYGGFNTKKNFKWCKQEKAVIMAFAPADVRTILKSCKGGDFLQIRDAAILTMLFETGVRCWELCCIKPNDVHGDYIIINGKNHKQRVVPVTPFLRKAMMKYELAAENYFTLKNTDDYCFLSFRGRQLTNSEDQNLDRQISAFLAPGATEREIITDKESGKDLDRTGYQALKNAMLRRGDALVVKSLDRLSRNKAEIKNELQYFKDNGIRLKVIDLPTTMMDLPEGQEWVFEMVNNILIEVLGTIAEQERATIKQRQTEDIEAAKKKGKKLGRPSLTFPENWEEVYGAWKAGEITAKAAMEQTGTKRTSFYKLAQMME